MPYTSADFRKQAEAARDRARIAKSLRTGAMERRRQRALNDLADNEDWLNGVSRQSDRQSPVGDRTETIGR
jgi:hypothetical protein